jgi:hypothetical protein
MQVTLTVDECHRDAIGMKLWTTMIATNDDEQLMHDGSERVLAKCETYKRFLALKRLPSLSKEAIFRGMWK